MAEIKHQLRKLGFPGCAKDALQIIEQLLIAHNAGRSIISNSAELTNEIVKEFVFCESLTSSGSRNTNSQLNSLQELQLLDILCSFFNRGTVSPSFRNALFLQIFNGCGGEIDGKTRLLIKLVSMAIATKSSQVLSAAGIWLQQNGPSTPCGLALAKSIVSDYLTLLPDAADHLNDLPQLAPDFSANFLAAVSELYNSSEKESIPPIPLIKVAANWASKTPGLCTTALTMTNPPVTPFFGLVRWCILAPLYGCDRPGGSYSQLHLAVLESILIAPWEQLLSATQLAGMVPLLLKSAPDQEHLNRAIDRFIQMAIVLMRSGKVTGNIDELFQQIETLPRNELIDYFVSCRNIIVTPPYFRLRT